MALDQGVLTALNGISFGMLLFVLAIGLQLVFGFMNIINLAHGSFYLIGGGVAFTVFGLTGNFLLAVLAGAGTIAVGSLVVERLVSRYTQELLGQALITWGFVYILADVYRVSWGSFSKGIPFPAVFSASIPIMGWGFPIYRLALIGIGLLMALGLWLFQEKTRLGAMVRAGVDDKEMASALGINIKLLAAGVFALGAFLAGLGGGLGAPIISLEPGLEWRILVIALVILVVGGAQSLPGAVVASLLIGVADNFSKILIPQTGNFSIFLIMGIVLMVRPFGLLTRQRREV